MKPIRCILGKHEYAWQKAWYWLADGRNVYYGICKKCGDETTVYSRKSIEELEKFGA